MERIICAAIHYNDGIKREHQPTNIVSGFVLMGLNHDNIIYTKSLMNLPNANQVKQGYITSENRFIDMAESSLIIHKLYTVPTVCTDLEEIERVKKSKEWYQIG